MKKSALLLLATILLVATSCKLGSNSTAKGLENQSFLEFVWTVSNYKGGVDVKIDDKTSFKAEVYKEKEGNNRIKGKVYAIPTGVHTVTVSYNGNLIYQKQIYVSVQETKKIILQ